MHKESKISFGTVRNKQPYFIIIIIIPEYSTLPDIPEHSRFILMPIDLHVGATRTVHTVKHPDNSQTSLIITLQHSNLVMWLCGYVIKDKSLTFHRI